MNYPDLNSLVKSILSQASGALLHMHSRGVVHRDIKLDNIMMT